METLLWFLKKKKFEKANTDHGSLVTSITGHRTIMDCWVRVAPAVVVTVRAVRYVVHTGVYTKIKQNKLRLKHTEERTLLLTHEFFGRLKLIGLFTDL